MRSFLELVEGTDDVRVDLVTLEVLKEELGITTDTEDDLLEARITRISKMIAEDCNRILGLASGVETFVFDTDDVMRAGQRLSLSLYPVVEIESVVMGGAEVTAGVDKERGLIWLDGAAFSGTVVVTYSGGYDLPDAAPAKLQAAAIEGVRDRRQASTGDPSVQSVTHGETRVAYFNPSRTAGSLPRSVLDLIAGFRRPAFA